MDTQQWMPYVGMISGIIGAATGVAGAIMGFIAYRRSNSIKALDLRLELRRTMNEIEQKTAGADKLLHRANQSRQRVMAATGLNNSGAMQLWNEGFQEDQEKLAGLLEAPPKAESCDGLTPEDLESRLVAAHKFQIDLNEILDKYEVCLDADDESRKEIRADMRARQTPQMRTE
jgi:hypothetical protein